MNRIQKELLLYYGFDAECIRLSNINKLYFSRDKYFICYDNTNFRENDIKPHIRDIRDIEISYTELSNIGFLADKEIKFLSVSLHNNKIKNLDVLKNLDLTECTYMRFDYNPIENINIFEELELPKLNTLILDHIGTKDYTPLGKKEIPSLGRLWISEDRDKLKKIYRNTLIW